MRDTHAAFKDKCCGERHLIMFILKSEFVQQIINQCVKELPNEACGILAGTEEFINGKENQTVKKVYEMTNAEKSPSFFFMDAGEQLRVMKEIRASGLKMIGIYHSHVASQAYPSAHDVELALYPDASYVIVSLKDRDNPGVRSFKIIEGKITEEEVKIID